jgi:hypothetical protein
LISISEHEKGAIAVMQRLYLFGQVEDALGHIDVMLGRIKNS